ncbi:hypothetical protein ABC383_19125 [Noviherbaspirillum sp. 1P10PC]|uniref:hypothetical protein n=1 Tax=Noviherbaspirillum sp. 1P10PC TaxID=3132292 RepID=UPI0039A2FA1D
MLTISYQHPYRGLGGSSVNLQAVFASLLFALFMLWIPWEELVGKEFEDKQVYINNFLYLKSIVEDKDLSGLRDFFFNEVLWDVLVRAAMDKLGIPIGVILNAVTFLCLFCFARFLAVRHGVLSILLLVNPLVVDFAFSQLRMAFAVSLVLLALSLRSRVALCATLVMACFIHTAMVLFIVMYLVAVQVSLWVRKRNFPVYTLAYIAMAGGALIALLIGPLRGSLLSSVGDRRAEYELGAATLSYASFWIGLLATVPLQKARFYASRFNLLSVACLATFTFATLMGVFAARFISALFPMLMSLMLTLGRPVREVMLLMYLVYLGLQWHYWFL